jgi:hypothetical protein
VTIQELENNFVNTFGLLPCNSDKRNVIELNLRNCCDSCLLICKSWIWTNLHKFSYKTKTILTSWFCLRLAKIGQLRKHTFFNLNINLFLHWIVVFICVDYVFWMFSVYFKRLSDNAINYDKNQTSGLKWQKVNWSTLTALIITYSI